MDTAPDPFGLRSLDIDVLRAKAGAKWQRYRTPYSAWVADMDFDVAPAIRDAVGGMLERSELGYPGWRTSPAIEQFVVRQHDRYGWDAALDRVHEFANVIQGLRVSIELLTKPGDGIVLHLPAYYPFIDTIHGGNRRLVPVSSDGGEFDYDDLERRLSADPARVWILCHPHNPLGRVFSRAELERIADIAVRHDLVVISDEVHADLTMPGNTHIPLASIGDEIASRTVTLTSASKAFNLAGVRWAVMHAGHQPLHDAIEALPTYFLGAPSALAVVATVAAWTRADDWLRAVIEVIDENRHQLGSLLSTHLPGTSFRMLDATYLAWVDCRALGLGDDPAATFTERGVALSPGHQFSPLGDGDGFVRINVATSPTILAAMIAAMAG